MSNIYKLIQNFTIFLILPEDECINLWYNNDDLIARGDVIV
jgi:hypothetical protein